MKIPAITFLLACALLGAGCSGGDETTSGPNPTLTPMPDYTQEEIAAMKDSPGSKEDLGRSQNQQALTAATSAPVQIISVAPAVTSPTATPAP